MYNASLKRKWDNKNVLDYAVKTAEQKGKHEKAVETAIVLKNRKIAVAIISEATGLSIEEIKDL